MKKQIILKNSAVTIPPSVQIGRPVQEILNDLELTIKKMEDEAHTLREYLLQDLKSRGIRRADLENGDSYVIYPRNKLVIKNEMSATKWWMENPEARGKMDTSKAIEVALTGKLKWAKVEKEEYLRISRQKANKERI